MWQEIALLLLLVARTWAGQIVGNSWFDYYTTILRVYMIDLTTDQLTFHLNSLLERFQFPHPEDHIHRALVIAFSALIFIINEMEDTARMLLNLDRLAVLAALHIATRYMY
ncbi:hypothetical protein C7M84_015588 [Penaeus vannamei]|uniref:Uncharacterized protein n=1 Tax=Penaeus vannamei TaxID=6689 RepID=A0A3R7NTM4_PENVA|nr:hypothetical protein C7M84_015588 [Penaeus vannamei]